MQSFAAPIAAIVVIVLAVVAYLVGRQRGREEIIAEQERDSAQAEKDRDKIDKDVASRPDDKIDKDLDPWHRD